MKEEKKKKRKRHKTPSFSLARPQPDGSLGHRLRAQRCASHCRSLNHSAIPHGDGPQPPVGPGVNSSRPSSPGTAPASPCRLREGAGAELAPRAAAAALAPFPRPAAAGFSPPPRRNWVPLTDADGVGESSPSLPQQPRQQQQQQQQGPGQALPHFLQPLRFSP